MMRVPTGKLDDVAFKPNSYLAPTYRFGLAEDFGRPWSSQGKASGSMNVAEFNRKELRNRGRSPNHRGAMLESHA